MAADDLKYKRLTWARRRSGFSAFYTNYASLWLGPDHLLCVDSNRFTESYKRFYFRDIQAFILRKTDAYKYWSLAIGLLGVFLALIGVVTGDKVGRIILVSFAGFFWFCMLLNLAFGPTTSCYLQTAVQIEPLPSLHRLRKARKVLNRLRPLIVSAQGELRPEEISARFNEAPAQPVQQPAAAETPAATSTAAPAPEAGATVEDPNVPPRIVS